MHKKVESSAISELVTNVKHHIKVSKMSNYVFTNIENTASLLYTGYPVRFAQRHSLHLVTISPFRFSEDF